MPFWVVTVCCLSLLASAICTWLLARAYGRSRDRVLLWSSACFFFLAINNLLAVIDMLLAPDSDLFAYRSLVTLCALGCLFYGVVWEEA
jgi:hypothetical protein